MKTQKTTQFILMMFLLLLSYGLFANNAVAQHFTDVTKEAGVGDSKYAVGVSFNDYDGDGMLDILVTNDTLGQFSVNLLYRNNGDGTFTDVTKKAGIDAKAASWGSPSGDYDNDGDLDLYIINALLSNVLYRNEGNGTFADVSKDAKAPGIKHTAAAVWGDYNGDGYLDVYLSNGDLRDYLPYPNILYRNNGDGTFADVTKEAGVDDQGHGAGALCFDYDNDGDLDIYAANYGLKPNVLYRNNGDGTFTDVTKEAGAEFFGKGHGPIAGDYDNDGDLDLYLPNDGPNILYRNNGDGTFADVTKEVTVGTAGHSMGPIFFDYDNDGDLDLYETNLERDANVLYCNNGDGTFTNVAGDVGLNHRGMSWGAAAGDYDNDGDLDIYLGNWAGAANVLYRNDIGNRNNWLHMKLIGTQSNRDAIGARVKLIAGGRSQMREISGLACFSQDSLMVEFGLAQNQQADSIEIRWPSGLVEVFKNVPANQVIQVKEGAGQYQATAVQSRGKLPTTFGHFKRAALLQNYPNPFNPETWIPFVIDEAAEIEIRIYDVSGTPVRTLRLGQKAKGEYRNKAQAAYWDGKNDAGEALGSGVYFYEMRAGDYTSVRKAMLRK